MAIEAEELSVTTRADHVPGPPQGRWTYEEYARIPDDGRRYEVLEGVLYVSPSPDYAHQAGLINLVIALGTFLRTTGLGELFLAPFDLLLPGATPVQPDLFLLLWSNPAFRGPRTRPLQAVPDLIVEVTSPSTATYDRRQKFDVYRRWRARVLAGRSTGGRHRGAGARERGVPLSRRVHRRTAAALARAPRPGPEHGGAPGPVGGGVAASRTPRGWLPRALSGRCAGGGGASPGG